MSMIITKAKLQGEQIKTVLIFADMLRKKLLPQRKIASNQRYVRRCVDEIVEAERAMIELAFQRPEDIEEFRNYDLVGAISNLTLARVNRIAYAGRVLP